MARSSILDDHNDEFQTRNNFLYFILGIIATARKLEEQLGTSERSADEEKGESVAEGNGEVDPADLRDLLL